MVRNLTIILLLLVLSSSQALAVSVNIENRIGKIYENGEIVFETDHEWEVVEALTGDFDADGVEDIGFHLWKTGNYGDSRPFWVEENDNSYRMHLFLYTWERGRIKALWHSSNLPMANIKSRFENGILRVIEKVYDKNKYSVADFIWNGWGFELEKRVQIPYLKKPI